MPDLSFDVKLSIFILIGPLYIIFINSKFSKNEKVIEEYSLKLFIIIVLESILLLLVRFT